MQKLVLASSLLVSLLLAACGSGADNGAGAENQSGSAAPAPTTIRSGAVTGTVALKQADTVIAAGAKLTLSLVDISQPPGLVVNSQVIDSPRFPQSFSIPYTAGQINERDLYVLRATMDANGRSWSTELQRPVLTRGQPAQVDLSLVAEPTRAEKMLDAFAQARRATGGLTVKSGTSSKIGESRSWQVFSDTTGVQFVIEQVNQTDKGFTRTEYAYRSGRPWVVVQAQMAGPNAAVSATESAGWSDDGELVVEQLEKSGHTSKLAEAEVKELYRQAQSVFKRFNK